MLLNFSRKMAAAIIIFPTFLSAAQLSPIGTSQAEIHKLTDTSNASTSTTKEQLAKQQLMQLLEKLAFFSASFTQQVHDEEGNTLQQASGSLVVSKPNLVRWNTEQPDESLIVSDGQTLWLFDPFIEQATAYKVDASIANTPILLLTSDDKKLWDKFTVSQINTKNYLIHAKDSNSRVKTLELNFNQIGKLPELASFTLLDSTGQLSIINLSDVDIKNKPKMSIFQFVLPEGIELDDQR